MSKRFLKEACIESLEEAKAAERLGADRIEFCSRLDLDGLTPNVAEVKEAIKILKIPIMVMIRPRAGGFEYADEEIQAMINEIAVFKEIGVHGVVFGVLKGKKIDFEKTAKLAKLAYPLEVCFHKAIDLVEDPVSAIEGLNEIAEVTRVLSSGQEATAEKGIETLKEMLTAARPDLSIMPAGKVKGSNIEFLHKVLQAKEYHGRSILLDY